MWTNIAISYAYPYLISSAEADGSRKTGKPTISSFLFTSSDEQSFQFRTKTTARTTALELHTFLER
jgi:hypothetical protein